MDNAAPLEDIARFLRRLQWAAVVVAALWLLGMLAPVLTPFVIAALLGWLGDPVVDRLEARGLSRGAAVGIVFSVMTLIFVLVLLLALPIVQRQVLTLVDSLPTYSAWIGSTLVPWVEAHTRIDVDRYLDVGYLTNLVREHWQSASGIAATVLGYVTRSGSMLIGILVNAVLVPVLAFFFLRDWDALVARIASLIPPRHLPVVTRLAKESDAVLGGFLRGQFMVMLILGVMYAVGLEIVGLDLGILIGMVAGMLTFVPYVGPASLLTFGGIAALVQFGDWQHFGGVLIVFVVGQLLESYWLTPKFVGNRIGLHPMAVIFAVLAGGQLFGFLGMLLALPLAAVVNVLLRYAQERYRASRLYGAEPSPIVIVESSPGAESGPG
ncbi:AI-2E family transporter [Lysobacter sp. TY2-98]|uniref:AI-2E family transporter n=1 Tax=Lysobacter sp. TY2-98 TaxID=2290922 RepID=UPI000E20990A|nr:AI-2E family transporter [Lysobacter sp. TY2-98]AXK71403.1 AI-2E family transporter [Lysobacter sp. TY2-98]